MAKRTAFLKGQRDKLLAMKVRQMLKSNYNEIYFMVNTCKFTSHPHCQNTLTNAFETQRAEREKQLAQVEASTARSRPKSARAARSIADIITLSFPRLFFSSKKNFFYMLRSALSHGRSRHEVFYISFNEDIERFGSIARYDETR